MSYDAVDVAAMREAIAMSATALENDVQSPIGGPFGSVIYKDGKKIAEGCNHVLVNNDPSAHGEVYTIREACRILNTWDLSDCVLYTSCEPCPMCLMTAKWANIKTIYFAATREDAANIGFRDDDLYKLLKDGVYATAIPECRDEAVEVMNKWYKKFSISGQY
ncbi:MAG: nucleoside deaminase [Acetobacter sp.]|nr:nucleoside deaminase [Acetobacter sp.]